MHIYIILHTYIHTSSSVAAKRVCDASGGKQPASFPDACWLFQRPTIPSNSRKTG